MEIRVKTFDRLSARELYELLKLRSAVFVAEQNCAYQDVDGRDLEAIHVWIEEGGEVVAALRILDREEMTAQIGRVVSAERGKGWGAAVLRAGIEVSRREMGKSAVYVEAQTYAKGFYAREGFQPVTEEFLEDGIPHIGMLLKL